MSQNCLKIVSRQIAPSEGSVPTRFSRAKSPLQRHLSKGLSPYELSASHRVRASGHWLDNHHPPPPPPTPYKGWWEGGGTMCYRWCGGGWLSSAKGSPPPNASAPECPFSGKGFIPYLPGGSGRYPMTESHAPHDQNKTPPGRTQEEFVATNSSLSRWEVAVP